MDYVIAIPTYKRYDILREQTLATLTRLKADPKRIHIFVADEEEKQKYEAAIGNSYKIIVGVKGISSQRKFYHAYFPDGTRIVSLDDDIADVMELGDKALVSTELTIDQIAHAGFSHAEAEGAHMWGINPTLNHFFLKPEISVGLRYICANFMGSYAHDWIFCDPQRRMTPTGEDHHSTLRGFTRYGSVVRLEYLCPKTKYFAAGGIDASVTDLGMTRAERHAMELTWVQSRYPDLSNIQIKAGGVVNLRLKPITFKRYPKEAHGYSNS